MYGFILVVMKTYKGPSLSIHQRFLNVQPIAAMGLLPVPHKLTKTKKNPSLEYDYIFFLLTLAVKSSILDHCPTRMQSLKDVLIKQGLGSSSLTTCYTSREHGWGANAFHSRCDLKGPTLLLARSGNNVFGGATEQSWGQGKSKLLVKS